ncbi:glycosyltransferase family 2 protein [uncultured Thiodictyon sp.]|uniref:glycosyltransferase family 2 protein n=1 Tax=uncultured Thiodictyon sp. TaxID=1846217 RepID=UPI0025FC24AA|nr:glycosyltransferase family 2 protein [uncultured Thiodictyon sp.]
MRCPSLNELPSPPPNKTGWPWTEETSAASARMPNGNPWPKISIVTPSYNQGQFLEETIRSVLLQGYPNLEYIIMDGGSSDSSVEIIHKYEPWLAYWVSEKDAGQAAAINNGFARATGSVFGWINSDDYYERNALAIAGRYFKNPNESFILLGAGNVVDEFGAVIERRCPTKVDRKLLVEWRLKWRDHWFMQQSCFWPAAVWRACGGVEERFELLFDYDLWFKFLRHAYFRCTDDVFASMRYYANTKTMMLRNRSQGEFALVYARHGEYDALFEMVIDVSLANVQLTQELNKIKGRIFYRVLRRLGWRP